MSLPERLQGWRAAAPAFRARQAKHLRQLGDGWHRPQQVSFVFGCQRSGTKMLLRVLDESPEIRIFHENNALAFQDFELRPAPVLRALAAASPARCQVFKPICDSQRADRLLGDFPAARGIWIFRQPGDVARSAVEKWGEHQREVVDAIARGDTAAWGWRTRGLPEQVVAQVRAVHRPDLTAYEGALLFWWVRNSFYFALGLDAHPRMMLVKYEDLVLEPSERFPAVFAHVGARFEPRFFARVHGGSVRGEHNQEVSPQILALCTALLERLDARAHTPAPPAVISPVAMIIDTLGIGGAERYVVMVANWMAAAGAELTVIAEPGGFEEELAPGVAYVDLPLDRVRKGIPIAAARVAWALARRPPAAIVAHSLATTWIARLALAGRRVPLVTVAHGWPEARFRRVAPLLRAAADMVVAVSPEVRDKLVAAGLPAERCQVIQNGVDCAPFRRREGAARHAARAVLGAGSEDVVVIVVGRLSAQKAHHHVFAIAERLRQHHPEVRFALVGEGERAEELRAMQVAAGLAERVRFVGVRRDVPDLLGSADLYLSCSDWEGMPLATIEAMASELPCVATHTEGTGLLLHEDCGVIVPVGDVEGMAAGIARLAEDAALRARMGAAARARALERFSHERVARELAELLERVAHAGV
ncbi:MAG: glycosyltransferase [Pseudomonadota bacterium]